MSNGISCLPGVFFSFFQGTIDLGGIVGCLPDVDAAVFTQQFPGERDEPESIDESITGEETEASTQGETTEPETVEGPMVTD